MTAHVKVTTGELVGEDSVVRLGRTLDASIRHASTLATELLDDGQVWHAGLIAGVVACLRGVARTVHVVESQLTGKTTEESAQ
jgi:hypothetical protein